MGMVEDFGEIDPKGCDILPAGSASAVRGGSVGTSRDPGKTCSSHSGCI